MAEVWFCQNSSSNASAANNWNTVAAGGAGTERTLSALAADDTLVANGKTAITLDVNVTCARLTNAIVGAGSDGGTFLTTDSVALTIAQFDVSAATAHTLLTASGASKTLAITCSGSFGGGKGTCLEIGGSVTLTMSVGTFTAANNQSTATATVWFRSTAAASTISFGTWVSNAVTDTRYVYYHNGTGTMTISASGVNPIGASTTVRVGASGASTAPERLIIKASLVYGATVPIVGGFSWEPRAGEYLSMPWQTGGATTKYYAKTIIAGNVLSGVNGDGSTVPATGTYHTPDQSEVIDTASFGDNSLTPGTYRAPTAAQVESGVAFGPDSSLSGTLTTLDPTLPIKVIPRGRRS
jgi:hypothetical protein